MRFGDIGTPVASFSTVGGDEDAELELLGILQYANAVIVA